jgi:hypothetical protein
MCTFIYLAADVELPEIDWDKEKPVFSVQKLGRLEEGDQVLQSVFTKPYIYFAASDAEWNCGCNFSYGIYPPLDEEDIANEESRRESIRSLRDFLAMAVEHGSVELYAEDVGNPEIEKVEVARRVVIPDFFGGDSFEFGERELLIVQKASSSSNVPCVNR